MKFWENEQSNHQDSLKPYQKRSWESENEKRMWHEGKCDINVEKGKTLKLPTK